MIYLTACSLCGPDAGMVWQLDPSVPADPATAEACDPAVVPGAGFPDTKASVHREAIDCLAAPDRGEFRAVAAAVPALGP
jgi:hypothetical protein